MGAGKCPNSVLPKTAMKRTMDPAMTKMKRRRKMRRTMRTMDPAIAKMKMMRTMDPAIAKMRRTRKAKMRKKRKKCTRTPRTSYLMARKGTAGDSLPNSSKKRERRKLAKNLANFVLRGANNVNK